MKEENKLQLTQFTYENPYLKQDFSEDNWKRDILVTFNAPPKLREALYVSDEYLKEEEFPKHPVKIEWHKKGEELDEQFSALIIQSDEGIFFFNLMAENEAHDAENKIKPDQEVTLEMIRGINNDFYYVVTDKNTQNDTINKLRF